jgi:CRISPR-associated exonuclease Cas4
MIPLSAINQFLFCPRRAALIHVEGIFKDNEHTLRGDIAHEHADLRGYEVVQGVRLLRALPVFSDRLGLSGKCDIVEQRPDGSLFPVEFKLGKRRQWANDDAQLCAQALCLEEMFHTAIPRGAVFHADSKRRREIEFTPALRALTEKTVAELHDLLDSTAIPRAEFREACEECSLYEICLPKATGTGSRVAQLAGQLFKT